MARFIVALAFILFSISSFAANVPQAANVIQGGFVTNGAIPAVSFPPGAVSKRVMLTSGFPGTTANNFYVLTAMGSQGQYQVTTGKTLHCVNLRIGTDTAQDYLFGYGTAALAAHDTATAPTGAVYYGPNVNPPQGGITFLAGAKGTYVSMPTYIPFPADSFPFVKVGASSVSFSMLLDCYED